MWSKILTLLVAGFVLTKAQEAAPLSQELPQERSLNHETDLNSIYVPVKSPAYYPVNAVFYQRPQHYAYNAPLFPTQGFYGPSTSYIDQYLSKPLSQLNAVEQALNKIPIEPPATFLLNKPNNLQLYASKPLPEDNFSELFSNLYKNQPKDWIFYNVASTPTEPLEDKSKIPTKASDKAAAIETLVDLLDKKPDDKLIVTSIIKPEILEALKPNSKPTTTTTTTSTTDALLENLVQNLLGSLNKKPDKIMNGIIKPEILENLNANPKPTIATIATTTTPTTMEALLEILVQKLLSHKRVEERLGAFYLKNTLLNRK